MRTKIVLGRGSQSYGDPTPHTAPSAPQSAHSACRSQRLNVSPHHAMRYNDPSTFQPCTSDFLDKSLVSHFPVFIEVIVCKTVRSMLSDCCLSVLSVCTLVHCGQTVGRIKMKLGKHVGLGPGHIVLDGIGNPGPRPKGAQPPNFRTICCGQIARWITMSHGSKV